MASLADDEFLYHTPAAKAGVLHIRSLSDDVLLMVARDEEWETPEFRQIQDFMDGLTDGESGRKTNPSWIQAEVLEAALSRGLISPEEFNYRSV